MHIDSRTTCGDPAIKLSYTTELMDYWGYLVLNTVHNYTQYSNIADEGDLLLSSNAGSENEFLSDIIISARKHTGSIRFATTPESATYINDFERMTIRPDGRTGIGITDDDFLPGNEDTKLEVRGTILSGWINGAEGYNYDGCLRLFPGGGGTTWNIDNRNSTLAISFGQQAGGNWPDDFPLANPDPNYPPKGWSDFSRYWKGTWDAVFGQALGKYFGFGCDPSKWDPTVPDPNTWTWTVYDVSSQTTYEKDFTWGPELIGMYVISDQPSLHYRPDQGGRWDMLLPHDRILRVERRDVAADDTAYTLISAGHLDNEDFVIRGNGNVGIGTSTPARKLTVFGDTQIGNLYYQPDLPAILDYRLSVDGQIVGKEIIVELNNWDWSDFVFDENYELMPIEELEQNIKMNGHLPQIPTAEEVSEKGINVGEMQGKLLQKIEELTLYVIELKKENKDLSEKLNKIEKVIENNTRGSHENSN